MKRITQYELRSYLSALNRRNRAELARQEWRSILIAKRRAPVEPGKLEVSIKVVASSMFSGDKLLKLSARMEKFHPRMARELKRMIEQCRVTVPCYRVLVTKGGKLASGE